METRPVSEREKREELFELYKLALDDYRFQVQLNQDRSRYSLVLNLTVIGIATGVVQLGQGTISILVALRILVALLYFAGFLFCIFSIFCAEGSEEVLPLGTGSEEILRGALGVGRCKYHARCPRGKQGQQARDVQGFRECHVRRACDTESCRCRVRHRYGELSSQATVCSSGSDFVIHIFVPRRDVG